MRIDRHFTVAVFVVARDRVLLHAHRKLGMWLPPGGHIEPGELPDEAALREVLEETGVEIQLVGDRGLPLKYPMQLIVPAGIQVEDIEPGHQHIDLVYFAVPANRDAEIEPRYVQDVQAGWYALDELEALGANEEIRSWSQRAIQGVRQLSSPDRGVSVVAGPRPA